ncbi:MAG: Asp-tRNA(Asn)/Glu-tRNA(Gln) amidotransferase subunit GatC [Candidatus Pacebacteria bacterium]|nr:Asp-tRNA(Asn)/Glu-tRNA(Gln) amidotransferase subunit GatC [Candidatus Paceibacterota bacterium]
MISTQDIEKLAELARIELKEEEKVKLAKEIDGILGYIDQIKTAGSKDIARAKEPVRNIFREDKNPHESGTHTDALVAEFPRKEGNYLKVKKIL